MNKQVGIFSGTFDPIHIGHVEVCLVAKAACELDEVLVLVEKNPEHKQGVASFKDRHKMAELALEDFPSLKVTKSHPKQITYKTTKKYLDKNYSKYQAYLIIGSDMVRYLEKWEDAEAIFKNMILAVFLRDLKEEKLIKSELENLHEKYDAQFTLLPPVWSEVSSSIVKNDIKKHGSTDSVHKKVLHYIKDKKLYDSSSGASK